MIKYCLFLLAHTVLFIGSTARGGVNYDFGSTLPIVFSKTGAQEISLALVNTPSYVLVAYRDQNNKHFGTFVVCQVDHNNLNPNYAVNNLPPLQHACSNPFVFHDDFVFTIEVRSIGNVRDGDVIIAYSDDRDSGWMLQCTVYGMNNHTCGKPELLYSGGGDMVIQKVSEKEIIVVWTSKQNGVGITARKCAVHFINQTTVCGPEKLLIRSNTVIPQNLEAVLIEAGNVLVVAYTNWKNDMKPELLACMTRTLHCNGLPIEFFNSPVSQINLNFVDLYHLINKNQFTVLIRTRDGRLIATMCVVQTQLTQHTVSCLPIVPGKSSLVSHAMELESSAVDDMVSRVIPGSFDVIVLYQKKKLSPCRIFSSLCHFHTGEDLIGGVVNTVDCSSSKSALEFEGALKGDVCSIKHIALSVASNGNKFIAANQGKYHRGIVASIGCAAGSIEKIDGDSKLLKCIACEAGRYSPFIGSHLSCFKCEEGKFNENQRGDTDASCQSCPIGKHHGQVGASSVAMCSPLLPFFTDNVWLILAFSFLLLSLAILFVAYLRAKRLGHTLPAACCAIVCFCFSRLDEVDEYEQEELEMNALLNLMGNDKFTDINDSEHTGV